MSAGNPHGHFAGAWGHPPRRLSGRPPAIRSVEKLKPTRLITFPRTATAISPTPAALVGILTLPFCLPAWFIVHCSRPRSRKSRSQRAAAECTALNISPGRGSWDVSAGRQRVQRHTVGDLFVSPTSKTATACSHAMSKRLPSPPSLPHHHPLPRLPACRTASGQLSYVPLPITSHP